MDRRTFINRVASGLLAAPLGARAQESTMPVVGFLYGASSDAWRDRFEAFQKGLAEVGYTDGRNVAFEIRRFEGRFDGLADAVSDLVRRQVAVIVATGGPQVALAAKRGTTTIPIVVTFGGDPVRAGLVASLNRPGGNVTGVSILTVELAAKLLDVFHEMLPRATTVAFLVNPENPAADAYARAATQAAEALGLKVHVLKAATGQDIEAAVAALAGLHAEGLLVAADPFFEIRRGQLIASVGRRRIPTFYFVREFVALGGLASYGTSFNEAVREAGRYTGRILTGAKPADLPILQPTKFELVINTNTAKTLGIAIPHSLLLRADEIIN